MTSETSDVAGHGRWSGLWALVLPTLGLLSAGLVIGVAALVVSAVIR